MLTTVDRKTPPTMKFFWRKRLTSIDGGGGLYSGGDCFDKKRFVIANNDGELIFNVLCTKPLDANYFFAVKENSKKVKH